ncbi:eIF2A-related protein [Fimbriiglobus ruber]|uniref:High-affnity carbon uptake protein Hat/HatR n=1 Tax=Fimbriiglobus ruber TaxID=1908690 RepID=A0A225DY95_9BACT|nr:WD40 repeat domain-containing protein [Fimbriiglobus ruber]OWK43508.1 High-affnity carbon uptake protein Hat/HatR [Fimbriiglobus ruber]
MSRFIAAASFVFTAALLAVGPTPAQEKNGPADKKGKDKNGPVVLTPDKGVVKTSGPLSVRALVQKPTAVKGAGAWSLETVHHRGPVGSIALSPDGQFIATGGLDGTIRLWEVATGQLARAMIGHDSYIGGLAFSADGAYLASGGMYDSTVRVWDAKTGHPIRVLRGHPDYVSHVAWMPEGRTVVAAGGISGRISVFDVGPGKLKAKADLGRPILSMATNRVGKELVVVGKGQSPVEIDTDSGKQGRLYGEADAEYTSLAFSPDGKMLVAGTAKDSRLFDTDTGTMTKRLASPAVAVAWFADSKQVLTSSANGMVVWDPSTGQKVKSLSGAPFLAFVSPDGASVYGGTSYDLYVWDVASGRGSRTWKVGAEGSAYWANGRPLVTGVGTPQLTLWDPATTKTTHTLEHTGPVHAIAWSPDGKSLAAASDDKTVRVWDPATGQAKYTFEGHKGAVFSVVWSPDGKSILSGAADGSAVIWEAATGKVLHALPGHAKEVRAVAWAHGGKFVATGESTAVLRVFSVDGKLIKEMNEPDSVDAVALSPDGKLVISSPRANVPRVWNVASGKIILELPNGGPPHASGFAVSPNGAFLAVARANHTLQLIDLKSAKLTQQQFLALATPVAVAWGAAAGSTTATVLGATCTDRCTRFFDPTTGNHRGMFVLEDKSLIAIGDTGHFRTEEAEPAELVYVAQTDKGQETLTVEKFAAKFSWKNVPANAKPTSK